MNADPVGPVAGANGANGVTGDPEPAWPADAVEVGRIGDAWGVKGWIKVQPFASDPKALFSARRWFVQPAEESGVRRPDAAVRARSAAVPTCLRVTAVKAHGNVVVAQVRGVENRAAAEALRGVRIFVGRSSFPTAGPDEYYWVDLLGLSVVNRENDALGIVVGLIDTGPHSVLRVAPEAGTPPARTLRQDVSPRDVSPQDVSAHEERLIPFVSAYVDDVNLEQRRIRVDWGLDF